MPIRLPPGAKVLTDRRLTLIRVLSTFTEQGGRLDQLKNAVKAKMAEKQASFAQSDLAIARLSGGGRPRSFVDPSKLHALVRSGRITLEQFLSVLCVRTSLLPTILAGDEIARLSKPAFDAVDVAPSLYTEFKPHLAPDMDAIEESILDSVGAAAAAA